jgi:hypothetical protein
MMYSVSCRYDGYFFLNKKIENDINKFSYNEIICPEGSYIDFPIIGATSLVKFISVHTIWIDLENYFISQYNDKNVDIATNKEKIINHGFDLKYSFRNCKDKK